MRKRIIIASAAVVAAALAGSLHGTSQQAESTAPSPAASATDAPSAAAAPIEPVAATGQKAEPVAREGVSVVPDEMKAGVRFQSFQKEPSRKLVQHPDLGEVIEVTYEDGSVLYEFNDPVYDLRTGKMTAPLAKEGA